MKVCIKCNIEKDYSEFGNQISRYKDNVYISLKGICRKCLNQIAKESYKLIKDTIGFKSKNAAKAKKYKQDNINKCKAKIKIAIKTEKYKNTRKKYIKAHKEKIFQQDAISKTHYHKKNRDEISDRYVANLLRSQGYGRPDDLIKNKELIEYKRTQVLLFRLKRRIHAKNFERTSI